MVDLERVLDSLSHPAAPLESGKENKDLIMGKILEREVKIQISL